MEATGSAPASSQSSGGLRGLIAQKERELHDINEYRLHTLESLVAEREREAGVAKESLAKLKEDFAYNLRLLEERDAELERYDESYASLRALVRERDAEISELRITAAEAAQDAAHERDRASEVERDYELKLSRSREDADAMRRRCADELSSLHEAVEAEKFEIKRQMALSIEAVEREQREAAAALVEESRKQAKEADAKALELSRRLREAESQVKAALADAAAAREAEAREATRATASETRTREVERAVEEASRESERRELRHNARVDQLSEQLRASEVARDEALTAVKDCRALLDASKRELNDERETRARREAEMKEVIGQLQRNLAEAKSDAEAARRIGEAKLVELKSQMNKAAAEAEALSESKAQHRVATACAEGRAAVEAIEAVARAAMQVAEEESLALRKERDAARQDVAAAQRELEQANRATSECVAKLASRAELSVHEAEALLRRADAAQRFEELSTSLRRELSDAEAEAKDARSHSERLALEVAALKGTLAASTAAAAETAAGLEAKTAAAEAVAADAQLRGDELERKATKLVRLLEQKEAELAAATSAVANGSNRPSTNSFSASRGRAAQLQVEAPSCNFPSLSPSANRPSPAQDRGIRDPDEESPLPSPPSVPGSIAVSPTFGAGKWGGGMRQADAEAPSAATTWRSGCNSSKPTSSYTVAHLEEENAGLRRAVSAMREEMQMLRNESARVDSTSDALEISEGLSRIRHLEHHVELLTLRLAEAAKGAGGDEGVSLAAAEVNLLRARVARLEQTRVQLLTQLREARSSLAPVTGTTSVVLPATSKMRESETVTMLQRKLSQMTATLAERTREAEALRASAGGGGEIAALQAKLTSAEADVARLAAEREKLMEISNMLRADLNRFIAEGISPESNQDQAALLERTRRELTSRYEAKLTEIESAMRELVTQNRVLKAELRRWTSLEYASLQASSAGASCGSSNSASCPALGPSKSMADSGGLVEPARCSAAGHADSHATGGHGQGVPAYLLKCGSCNINASLSATKERMPLSSETENRSAPHSAHLGNGGENVSRASCLESDAHNANVALGHWTPLPSRYPDSRDLRQDGEAARLRARERLEAVRESLSLNGTNSQFSERPPSLGQTARGTTSQTKARQSEIERKRAELSRRQNSIRNWAHVS